MVVVWSRETRFEDWPTATLFTLKLAKGSWVIVDAATIEGKTPPEKR